MSVTSHVCGRPIEWRCGGWYYIGSDEPVMPWPSDGPDVRPHDVCLKCGEVPTLEGFDACLGRLPDVMHACCGHGVERGYTIDLGGKFRYL